MNDLLQIGKKDQIHGQHNSQLINQSLNQVDTRALSGLNEVDYK